MCRREVARPEISHDAKTVYRGARMGWFEGFEAWRRTKFETKLDINEKISQILGGQGIGSRIQVRDLKTKSVLGYISEKRIIFDGH